MKCIRVHCTENEDGSTTISALVDATTDTSVDYDDWNTLIQVLRLREKSVDGVLIWDEGSWDEKVWG